MQSLRADSDCGFVLADAHHGARLPPQQQQHLEGVIAA
jgi:hypothetical protein